MEAASLWRELPAMVRAIPYEYVGQQRWFGSKGKDITGIALKDAAILERESSLFAMALIELRFQGLEPEVYYFPLALRPAESTVGILRDIPASSLLKVESPSGVYLLYDGLSDEEFLRSQFREIETSGYAEAGRGRFSFASTQALSSITGGGSPYRITSLRPLKAEQSNTSIIYNDSMIMKNFRRLQNGANPDLEVPLFLTTRTKFRNSPLVAGYVEYSADDKWGATIASLQSFVPNQGDGWAYTLDHLRTFYEFALKYEPEPSCGHPPAPAEREQTTRRFSDSYLRDIRRLGEITGELHNALASDAASLDFAPEPITGADVDAWVSRIQTYSAEVMRAVDERSALYSTPVREQIAQVVSNGPFYLKKAGDLAVLAEARVWKTRYHNDYHLGQVLKTGDDFVIIDFEGEPARPIEERRTKQSPLKDVAGMLRSFNYAAYAELFKLAQSHGDKLGILETWGKTWETLAGNAFLDGYLKATGGTAAGFLPHSMEAMHKVLSAFQLDKAIYELNYEINNRPTWLEIPLKYLLSLL